MTPKNYTPDDGFITADRAAKIMGLSVQTVIRYCKDGKLGYYRKFNNFFVNAESVKNTPRKNLHHPFDPRCDRIIELLDKQVYADLPRNPVWKYSCPKAVGFYLMRCVENELKPEMVRVYYHNHYGELWVEDLTLCDRPLQMYHDNLGRISWKLLRLE